MAKKRRIFLSYRREDSIGHVGRLRDRLIAHFDEALVFMDVTSINPGINAIEAINKSIKSSGVMVVIIGKSWLKTLRRREKSVRVDHMRLEIVSALKRRLPVIPVLVAKAKMPHEEELPMELRGLGSIQPFELSDANFDSDVKLLIETLESMTGNYRRNVFLLKRGKGNAVLSVVGIDDVLAWGWDGKQLLEELFALDRLTVEGLDPNYTGTVEQWAPIIENHPYTWRLIIDKPGSIVGNWHFIAIADAPYRKALRGLLRERDITETQVRYMDQPGWYDIYFLAVFLLPRLRVRLQNLLLLRRSILDHFTELAREGVFINRICAHAYSAAGEAFCKSFNMQAGALHIDHGRIYKRNFYPLPSLPIFREYEELNQLYAEAVKRR